jgi:hypothetical protein
MFDLRGNDGTGSFVTSIISLVLPAFEFARGPGVGGRASLHHTGSWMPNCHHAGPQGMPIKVLEHVGMDHCACASLFLENELSARLFWPDCMLYPLEHPI